jgi:hypothetical protein
VTEDDAWERRAVEAARQMQLLFAAYKRAKEALRLACHLEDDPPDEC